MFCHILGSLKTIGGIVYVSDGVCGFFYCLCLIFCWFVVCYLCGAGVIWQWCFLRFVYPGGLRFFVNFCFLFDGRGGESVVGGCFRLLPNCSDVDCS